MPYEQVAFAKNLFKVFDFLSGADYKYKKIFVLIDSYLDDKIDPLNFLDDFSLSKSSDEDIHYSFFLKFAYEYFHEVFQILSEEEGNKSYPALLKDIFDEKLKCDPYYTNIYMFLIKEYLSDVNMHRLLFRENKINNFEDANIANMVKDFVDNVCGFISKECSNKSYNDLIKSVKEHLLEKYPELFSYNLNPEISDEQFAEALVDYLFESKYFEIRYKGTSINDFTNEKRGWLVQWRQYEKEVKEKLSSTIFKQEQLKAAENNLPINNDLLEKMKSYINGINGLYLREFYTLILQR